MFKPRAVATIIATLAVCLLLPPALEAARAPVGRHYMVLEIEHLLWPPTMIARQSCLRFAKDQVCDHEGWCGGFVVNESSETGNRWWATIDKRNPRDPVELILFGHTEAIGRRSSIGGTIIFDGAGATNGAFLGLEAPKKRCIEFAEDGPEPPGCVPPEECCKICSDGKACGDSCISRSFTCRRPRGCACNASEVCRQTLSSGSSGLSGAPGERR